MKIGLDLAEWGVEDTSMTSLKFEHLRSKWPQLTELGGMAEQYVHSDPSSAVAKMRIFTEQMLIGLYRQLGFSFAPKPKLIDLLEGDEFQAHARARRRNGVKQNRALRRGKPEWLS
jgi:hypothetical protein